MKVSTLLLIGALSSSAAAFGADAISAKDFVKKAAEGGAAEVEMGQLASTKATDPQVKAFAQKMVTDHTKANKELMAAAKAKGLEVPTEPRLMEKGMKEKFEHQSASGDFNRDYMEHMVKDHEKDVKLFQTAANDTTLDPELRALAKKTLPTLQEHLADAQKLEAKLAQAKQ
jgi:putative membrane protein